MCIVKLELEEKKRKNPLEYLVTMHGILPQATSLFTLANKVPCASRRLAMISGDTRNGY